MKVKPQIYAKALLAGLLSNKNRGAIARNFWHLLAKNKQQRDLPKIMEALDREYAKSENILIAKVYSENPLTKAEESEIIRKLKGEKRIILKNIFRRDMVGIKVEMDDKRIDLSISGKADQLKQRLNR